MNRGLTLILPMCQAFDTTIDYTYDDLSRLTEADYVGGSTYSYGYDLAGNLINNNGVTNTFNDANQLTGDGTDTFDYDNNGNLWKTNSVVSHIWDKANRLLSHGGLDYAYDGLGNRISQDNGTNVTSYLLDLQAGLPRVLSETVGANVTQFVHSPRGLHATQNNSSNWFWGLQDGLGSNRAEVDVNGAVVASQEFTPYGVAQNVTGSFNSPHAFTGEPVDANGLQYHRARYYSPEMGSWIKQDLIETPNRYGYVDGNPINMVDPTGLQGCSLVGAVIFCRSHSAPVVPPVGGAYDPNLEVGHWLAQQWNQAWSNFQYNLGNIGTFVLEGLFPTYPVDDFVYTAPQGGGVNEIIAQAEANQYATLNPQQFPGITPEELLEICNSGFCDGDIQDLLDTLTNGDIFVSAKATPSATATAIPKATAIPTTKDYGDCTKQQHDGLNEIVGDLCKSSIKMSCIPNKLKEWQRENRQTGQRSKNVVIPKELIQERIDNSKLCEKARQDVQDACFSKSPDIKHTNAIAELQVGRARCEQYLADNY